MIREFKTYRWSGSDSPIKEDDHCLDELRYYIMSLQNKNEVKVKSQIQKDKEKLIRKLNYNIYEN